MKTKLLKRLRNNYQLIEESRADGSITYRWKLKNEILLRIVRFPMFLITPIISFFRILIHNEFFQWSRYMYITSDHTHSWIDTLDNTDKSAVFDHFVYHRISKHVKIRADNRREKRRNTIIKNKVVWYEEDI